MSASTSPAPRNVPAARARILRTVALGVILAVGVWLRAAHLGQPSFDSDEYYHVTAAKSVLAGQGPSLPSGHRYERAQLYTWIVAGSFRAFGVSETSARLPSMVFGVLLILAAYGVGRRWFGVGAGLIAAGLVAVAPMLVATSRLCRMYSLFQLLYLLAVFAYYRGAEEDGVRLRARLAWLGAGGLLLLTSLHVHELTLDMGPAMVVFWAGCAAARWRSRHALFLLGAAAAALLALSSGWVTSADLWQRATRVPAWAEQFRAERTLYIDLWREAFPWIWRVAPLAAVYAVATCRARGWLVVCQFAVPFALHTWVFPWREYRYVTHIFPFAALLLSPLLAWGVRAIWGWSEQLLAAWTLPRWLRASLAAAALGLAVASWTGLSQPWLRESLALQDDPTRPRWREAFAAVASGLEPQDAVVTAMPLAAPYYLGRPATHVLDNHLVETQETKTLYGTPTVVDWYSGLPMITSLEAFERLEASSGRKWVIVDQHRLKSDRATPAALSAYLIAQCQDRMAVADGSVRVFLCGRTAQLKATLPQPLRPLAQTTAAR